MSERIIKNGIGEGMEPHQEEFFNECEALFEKYSDAHPDEFLAIIPMVKIGEGIQQKIMLKNGSLSMMADIFEDNASTFRKKSLIAKMKAMGGGAFLKEKLQEMLFDLEDEPKEETKDEKKTESND